MHAAHVPGGDVTIAAAAVTAGTWLAWMRHDAAERKAERDNRERPHPRLRPTEAALIPAAVGGWTAAAVTWGPLAGQPPWLTLAYLAVTGGGYAWLRRHRAVRAARARRDEAAAWTARKTWWHQLAPGIGLAGFDLLAIAETHLGEELTLTGSPYGVSAAAVAANPRAVIDRWLQVEGLPYGSIDFASPFPGRLVVNIRRIDPSVNGPVRHPALDPASPFADLFPAVASVRDPVPALITPETGEVVHLVLWDQLGGKVIGVYGAKRAGKTTLLDVIRERVTAMGDAVIVQANGAAAGDELAWEPLAAATAAGSARFDPDAAAAISAVLDYLVGLVTDRSATGSVTGDSVFQPTEEEPAIVAFLDEVDEIVTQIPDAKRKIEFLASKAAKAAITLLLGTQRAINQWTGGGAVRANLDQILVGWMTRGSETRHATGGEDIPDIGQYSSKQPGFFQVWDPIMKKVTARGRGFDFGTIGEQQQHVISRRDPASRPALPGQLPGYGTASTPDDAAGDEQAVSPGGQGLRDRLAAVISISGPRRARHRPDPAQAAPPQEPVQQPGPAAPGIPGVPAEDLKVLTGLLFAPDGTTSGQAAQVLGKHRSTAHEYLTALCKHGIARRTGEGRGSRFVPAAPEPRPYMSLQDLTEAVAAGLTDADDEQKAVFERVHDALRRQAVKLAPGTESGDAP
jgi:hypothetical protein